MKHSSVISNHGLLEGGEFDRLFIDGDWVKPESAARITVISPATETVFGSVPSATKGDVDRAVIAAERAFNQSPWPRYSIEQRIEILRQFRELLDFHSEAIAQLITSEMGSPIAQSRSIQLGAPLAILDEYCKSALEYPWTQVRRGSTGNAIVQSVPVGVVAAIVPWNMPLTTTVQKIVPAILAGCTIVLKPSPETSFDAYVLAALLQEAGLPDGVLNVVPAERDVSEYLVTRPEVNKVSFTGSTTAGRRIASLCGNDLRRVTLELGGKSAAIILDDADLDATVAALRLGSFRNSGQICTLKTRILVPRHLEGEFIDKFTALVRSMRVGDPTDETTDIGPMVSQIQRDRVWRYIDIANAEGAVQVTGGSTPPDGLDRGWYVRPTIFSGVTPAMRIAQEEVFGPVVTVLAYDTVDEAISIANDSRYGLSGAVFTDDIDRGFSVASRMRTGIVELNGNPIGFQSPFGGFNDSGIGREQGSEGLRSFVELRSLGVPEAYLD